MSDCRVPLPSGERPVYVEVWFEGDSEPSVRYPVAGGGRPVRAVVGGVEMAPVECAALDAIAALVDAITEGASWD